MTKRRMIRHSVKKTDHMILPYHFRRSIGLLAPLLFGLLLVACSAPVQVDRVDLRTAYDDLNRTALSSDRLSEATRTVLPCSSRSKLGQTKLLLHCAPRPLSPGCT